MSNKNQKERTESILNSMKGASRAVPNPTILDRIKAELTTAQMIEMSPMKKLMMVAAAIAILAVNINALRIINNEQSDQEEETELYSYTLISDYKI